MAEIKTAVTDGVASVEITRNSDTLTAELQKANGSKFTTSAAVTYEWHRDGEVIEVGNDNTYEVTAADRGKSIKVKVPQYGLESNIIDIASDPADDQQNETTPAAVRITGTQKVGYNLTAKLIDKDEKVTTTSAAVTYNWYRLNSSDSEFNDLVATGTTYTLTSSDLGKYIGLTATYAGGSFNAKTGIITASSSGSDSSSSSSSSSSTNDKTTETNDNHGALAEGWNQNSTDRKYIKDGKPVTGWNQINGDWYLMDSTGTMQIGWRQTNGVWYLLKNDGAMAKGWEQSNGEWYFLNNSGAMETGWELSNGQWYFLKDDGTMAKGWVESNGIWYLLKDNGAMAIGWQQSNGEWYYLYSDGAMASNTIIGGYKLAKNGPMVQ